MSKLTVLAKMTAHCRSWRVPFVDRLGWLVQGLKYPATYRGTNWSTRVGVGDFGVLNEMFLHGSYDGALWRLRAGVMIIDIGANIDAFSMTAAKTGAAVVWAFERVPANLALLEDNLARNQLESVSQTRRQCRGPSARNADALNARHGCGRRDALFWNPSLLARLGWRWYGAGYQAN